MTGSKKLAAVVAVATISMSLAHEPVAASAPRSGEGRREAPRRLRPLLLGRGFALLWIDLSEEPGAPQALRRATAPCPVGADCEPGAPGIPLVTVGHPGNPADVTGFGSVDHVFDIGRYEVTSRQYTDFLNAVARADTYGLYNPAMESSVDGCGIRRTGAPGGYAYAVDPDQAVRPVNYVSWGDAARFANWLHNGRPAGAQDLSSTEDGSYYLNGVTGDSQLAAVVREPDATWVLPSEDEWYKAAYHANDGATASYFTYPTSSNVVPSNALASPDPGNNATYQRNGYTIGPPYYRTPVGAHASTRSPYGAFDMAGNVFEWNEAMIDAFSRGIRGGSYLWGSSELRAPTRPYEYYSPDEFGETGFRVGRVR